MRFFSTFLRTLATLAVAYAVAAAIVNPRRELIGHFFPALQPNSRATKWSMFEEYRRASPVRGLILGSSRSMMLAPSSLEKLTGQPFFNLAVFSGRAEDYLVLYRAAIAREPDIKIIVVGVDPEGFNPDQPSEQEFDNNAQLVQLLRGSPFTAIDWAAFVGHRLAGLYTVGYVRDVAVSVAALRHRPIPMYAFRPDGSVTYPKFDGEIASGQFSLDRALAACPEGATQLASIARTDSTRLGYLRDLVTEARARGATVILWAPPMHPRYEQAVNDNPAARQNLDRALGQVRAIAAELSVPFVDLTRSESYGSDPTAWYDCVHVRSAEADRIAARLTAAAGMNRAHGF